MGILAGGHNIIDIVVDLSFCWVRVPLVVIDVSPDSFQDDGDLGHCRCPRCMLEAVCGPWLAKVSVVVYSTTAMMRINGTVDKQLLRQAEAIGAVVV